jgi:mannan endo-1,4-beta-mannosidase
MKMKLASPILLAVFVLVSSSFMSGSGPSDKKATRETVSLFRSLSELQNKGVMYGHQDDLMYGSMVV